MHEFDPSRRSILVAGTSGLLFAAGASSARATEHHEDEKDVSAVEDMMREHGVLRRALLVYGETAARLRAEGGTIDPKPLNDTAMLFRIFGALNYPQVFESLE